MDSGLSLMLSFLVFAGGILLALGVAVGGLYFLIVRLGARAPERFFGTLIERLAQLLGPKGFTPPPKVQFQLGLATRSATFARSDRLVDLVWDDVRGELRLQQRGTGTPQPPGEGVLVRAKLHESASSTAYAAAAEEVIAAAARIDERS